MLNKLFKKSAITKENTQAKLTMSGPVLNILFKDIHIATLYKDNSEFCLVYKPSFLNTGLIPFHVSKVEQVTPPEPNKVYHSTELWPSFRSRIPSGERDDYLELLNKNNLNENSDPLTILGAVGRISISKPWRLELVKNTSEK